MAAEPQDRNEPDDPSTQSTVVEYDDAPNECTIFLSGVSRTERMTTWITAKEGSYVDLQSAR